MTKQNYIILGIILIIVLVFAGAVFVREKGEESAVTPAPITPTPTPETRQPENSPNTQTPKTPEDWKTYENKEFGFAFDYPGEFEVGTEGTLTGHGIVKGFGVDFPGTFLDFSIYKDLDIIERKIEIENSFRQVSYNIKGTENIKFSKTVGIKFIAYSIDGRSKGITVYLLPHPFRKNLLFDISVNNKYYSENFFSLFRFLP